MKTFFAILLLSITLFGAADLNPYTKMNISDELSTDFNDEFESEDGLTIISDYLSIYNRSMTNLNDYIYINALTPIATEYEYIIPKEVRKGISNIFNNLYFPVRFVNNLLQLKFENAADEGTRFLINSTVGLLGIFDPALDELKIKQHNEDFGQTLGFYGVKAGPHIVLPLLGPSNLRDMLSRIPDAFLNPTSNNFYNTSLSLSDSLLIYGYYTINRGSLHLGEYESFKKDALDLYPYLRNYYEQSRIKDIKE